MPRTGGVSLPLEGGFKDGRIEMELEQPGCEIKRKRGIWNRSYVRRPLVSFCIDEVVMGPLRGSMPCLRLAAGGHGSGPCLHLAETHVGDNQ